MPNVDLPVMAISTELSTALAKLRKCKRSALVAKAKGEYRLFNAGSIVVGQSKGKAVLSDLEPAQIISRQRRRERSRGFVLEVALPDLGAGAADVVADYVLTDLGPEFAHVLIRDSQVVTNYVSGPKDCYCDGPGMHDFPPPNVLPGAECPFRDGRIVCSRG
jgi:hypothetical protein